MSQCPLASGVPLPQEQRMVRSYFNVRDYASHRPLLAWRDRVGHVMDIRLSLAELDLPFQGAITRYGLDDLSFTDCRTGSMRLERSLARISTDAMRDFAFHVFLEGGVDDIVVRSPTRLGSSAEAKILAVDLGQPISMRRHECRMLTLFVPGTMVAEAFPNPESIHGRTLDNSTPLTRLIVEHVGAISRDIAGMNTADAGHAIRSSAHLLVSAFGKQAGISGNARSAVRAAMVGQVRRYIEAHLKDDKLSPESILDALQLPRPTLYRLFQHDGGLGAYIRHHRLRQAAAEIVTRPHATFTEIAFSLGFKSSSDFTRAFRRAYDMTPQDFRHSTHKGLSSRSNHGVGRRRP